MSSDVGSVKAEQPKLFSYCNSLYEFMDSNSTPGLSDTDTPNNDIQVWRGRLLETCESLGIPKGGTTRVVGALRALGCVEQIARGFRGTALSEFILHYPPTAEVWAASSALNVKSRAEGLTRGPSPDRLAADVRDLKQQLGGINLIEAIAELDRRISKLESLVKNGTAEVS